MPKGWKHPLGIMEFSELQYFIPYTVGRKRSIMTNKMMNEKGFAAKMETIDEIVLAGFFL